MSNIDFSVVPSAFEERRSEILSREDVNSLVEAFHNTTSALIEDFGQFHLKLPPGDIESLLQEHSRKKKIFFIFQKWKEQTCEKATLSNIELKMNEAKLIATKQRFWNYYRDNDAAKMFNDQVEKLQDFINKLAKCAITETEWTKLIGKLNIQDESAKINDQYSHNKILQRVNTIFFWVEKLGYVKGSISNLENALKAEKLRRVTCEIAGTPVNQSGAMNLLFSHFLEDEWDYIFSKLSDEKQKDILNELHSKNIDEAFNLVMSKGNEGFHSFIKALRKQCKDHVEMVSLFNNEDNVRLCSLHKMSPKVPYFKESKAYESMKNKLNREKCLGIYGLPGSGKSQCASAYAVKFKEENPMSIVWFLDCKNRKCIDDSITSLHNSLINSKICQNNKLKDEVTRASDIASAIKKSKMFVLLVLEDLSSSSKMLCEFLEYLKAQKNERVFILATARNTENLNQCFQYEKIHGFTTIEALDYLMPDEEEFSEKEKDAAKEIVDRYSNLPLGIAPSRAFCKENSLSYIEYLEAMDEEIQAIGDHQDILIDDYYRADSDKSIGKNIFATMVLALSSLKDVTFSNKCISLLDIFSHVIYFHHEKIPVQLFKQLIVQPDLLLKESHQPVKDFACKVAINNLLRQLEHSSLAVVDRDEKDTYVSTHRVVVRALKHIASRKAQVNNPKKNASKLLNAIHALTCYFQKDNRLKHQHELLITLMPHVSSALSMVQSVGRGDVAEPTAMLEAVVVIRLLELKGFACTQSNAMSEAAIPLEDAYKQLLHLLFKSEKLSETDFRRKVEDLTKDSSYDKIKAEAKLLTQFCEAAVEKISSSAFSHLSLTICINQEDIDVLKRNSVNELHEDIKVNYPLTANALKWLRDHKLAISEENLKKTYLAELLASIAYTRGRLMFYDGFSGDKEKHGHYLELSYAITKEVFKQTEVRLLHLLLADTNGLLYRKLNNDSSLDSYEDTYKTYEEYLRSTDKFYEHGVLKEDGKTDYHQMRCYKQMISANHHRTKLLGRVPDDELFEVCNRLKDLVHSHPQYAKTAVNSLLVAGKFASFGKKHVLAMEIFREVMDRLNNEEERYQQSFIHATKGFCKSSLKRFAEDQDIGSREGLKEAKQRCEKAQVLIPRSENVKDIQDLSNHIDATLKELSSSETET